jgi:hypothetical protein
MSYVIPTTAQEPTTAKRSRYLRPAILAAVVTALLGLAVAVCAALSVGPFTASAPASPASVLTADGYSVTQTLTAVQMKAAGDFNDSSGKMLEPYVVAIAAGTHGKTGEGVVQLTDSGRTMIGAILPLANSGSFGSGVTAHMSGNFLVLDGPAGQVGFIGG